MSHSIGLTTNRILAEFSEEIAARGGKVTDTFDDGRRLFTRSVLNLTQDVRPRDQLQGGVALKATEDEVSVHPFLFRQVCRNGAIMAETIATERLTNLDWREPDEAIRLIRAAVGECCREEVFCNSVEHMRSATELDVDLTLMMLPMLSRLSEQDNGQLLAQVLDRFFRDGDQSRFGLVQAVTSVARDTRDPGLRWDLEEFGGGIAAGILPQPSGDFDWARAYSRPTEPCGV
jgi:hypothetical protein